MVALVGTDGGETLDVTEETTSVNALGGNDTISFALDLTAVSTSFTTGVIDGGAGDQDVLSIGGFVGADPITVNGVEYDAVVDLLGNEFQISSTQTITLAGIERAFGSAGNDYIVGSGAQGEVLTGNAGDDVIVTGFGQNGFLDGGDGIDTISFENYQGNANAGEGIFINLGEGGPLVLTAGFSYIQNANNFENIIGSAFNDNFVGSDDDNVIEGGAGADQINGAGGNDTASYANSDAGVTAVLGGGNDIFGSNDAAGDVFTSIENLTGSAFRDALIGDVNDNVLDGGEGSDFLSGGEGSDTLLGGADNDVLSGGAGADTMDGGEGLDNADYRDAQGGVTVDLAEGTGSGGDAQGDVYISIEAVLGSVAGDAILGNDSANLFRGNGGDDLLDGAGGNDTLLGGAGNDSIYSGSGIDRLFGGDGDDSFVFEAANEGRAVIYDFGGGDTIDVSDLASIGIENFEDVQAVANGYKGSTVLAFDDHFVTLVGVDVDSLTADMFDFGDMMA